MNDTQRNLLRMLADRIEKDAGAKFTMLDAGNLDRGMRGCIISFARQMDREMSGPDSYTQFFGVDHDNWRKLTQPATTGAYYACVEPELRDYIGPERAAAQIRHLAETGSVDWSATPT